MCSCTREPSNVAGCCVVCEVKFCFFPSYCFSLDLFGNDFDLIG
jgi:hypothetical protein